MVLLETKDLTLAFGGLSAVSRVNLTIREGELVGLIGPNGAGKTTVFNLLTGIYRPQHGDILWQGRSLVGMRPFQITQLGVARTFQNIRLFGELTVLDNLTISCHWHSRYPLLGAVLRLPSYYRHEGEMRRRAEELLELFGLKQYASEKAKNLPYGEQRRLEIARALAARPRLLLLDEPAAGMNPQETQALMDFIRWLRQEFSLSILLIEHDMSLVMNLCERIYALDYGEVIAEGTPGEIRRHPRVIEAYLGEEVAPALVGA
ncbi:ABC transporter ATP-binding protein [Thermanaeromonas sp. C210]|uniref:ABC transporter ATP-binding protein n=1 Tax=Thermanaeromonas sp. C210 TaxID=2731925 RepID=UPI00155BFCF7|nr:ABC transporter ATP-binding protein [Thermanaeromonas sp. C210]GFN23121.1 ABC transporter ATP-binding protein [Thermanaeromonas sp. C210]